MLFRSVSQSRYGLFIFLHYPLQLPTPHCKLPSLHSKLLYILYCKLPTSNSKLLYILYCKLQTPHCKLQTAHCKLPTPHSPLLHLSSLSTANCPLITSSWRVPPAVGSGFRLMYRPLRVRHAASIPRAHCNASTAARRANQRSCQRTQSSPESEATVFRRT